MNIKTKAAFSIIWIGFGSLIATILRFSAKIILARILAPTDFGLFAIVLLFINSLTLFSNLGLGAAIIQRKKQIREASNTAFHMAFIMGALLFVIAFIFANQIAIFFNQPKLTTMIQIFSLTLFFLGIELIPSSLLIKELSFGKRVFVEMLSVISFFLISIILAYFSFDVWSLVLGQFASMFVSAFGMLIISQFRPEFKFNLTVAKELLGYGKYMIMISIMGYLLTQGDNLFVGKFLGAIALGYYAMAYTIANLSTTTVSFVISSLSFPIFAKLQEDKTLLKKAYLKILRLSFFIIIPIAFGTFALAPEIIITILGPKWMPSIPVLQVLCFFAIFRSFHHIGGYFFQAIGNPRLHTSLCLFEVLTIAILIYPFSFKWDLVGIAIAIIIPFCIGAIYLFFKIRKKLNITGLQDIKIIIIETGFAFLMMDILLISKNWLNPLNLVGLLILISFGGFIYFVLIQAYYPTLKKECLDILEAIRKPQ